MGPSAAVNAVYFNKIQEVPAGPERDVVAAAARRVPRRRRSGEARERDGDRRRRPERRPAARGRAPLRALRRQGRGRPQEAHRPARVGSDAKRPSPCGQRDKATDGLSGPCRPGMVGAAPERARTPRPSTPPWFARTGNAHPLADATGRIPLSSLSRADAAALGLLPVAPGVATVRVAPTRSRTFRAAHPDLSFSVAPPRHALLDVSKLDDGCVPRAPGTRRRGRASASSTPGSTPPPRLPQRDGHIPGRVDARVAASRCTRPRRPRSGAPIPSRRPAPSTRRSTSTSRSQGRRPAPTPSDTVPT